MENENLEQEQNLEEEHVEEKTENKEEIEEIHVEEPQDAYLEEPKVVADVRAKKRKGKSIVGRIFNIIFWLAFLVWAGICIYDFMNVQQEKDPMFCISEKTTTYDDGTVYSCTGLGYKVFKYQRTSYTGLQFGPFWITEKNIDEKTQ